MLSSLVVASCARSGAAAARKAASSTQAGRSNAFNGFMIGLLRSFSPVERRHPALDLFPHHLVEEGFAALRACTILRIDLLSYCGGRLTGRTMNTLRSEPGCDPVSSMMGV